MAQDDYYKKKKPFDPDAVDDDDGSGTEGSGIEFHDFIGVGGESREKLPKQEKDRLLNIHDAASKDHVEKQEKKRQQYEDLKNGKRSLSEHRRERMGEGARQHPLLGNDPRYSGLIDSNNNPVPSENNNEANENDKKELELQFQLQNQPKHQHENKFQPPRLTK